MTAVPRHRDVLALTDLLYSAAAELGVRFDDVTLTPGVPGPEVVIRIDEPGARALFASRIRMPHPESFPPAPVAGRIETYTTTYLGIRVQVVGTMPDPLATVTTLPTAAGGR